MFGRDDVAIKLRDSLQLKYNELRDRFASLGLDSSQDISLLDKLAVITPIIESIPGPVEKVIPNNDIIGPSLAPQQITTQTPIQTPGQVNKIPIFPIAVGVGILIITVALTKRRKH